MTDDRTPEVTHFSDAAEWTGVSDSDRTSWLQTRRTMVTASSVAALLGLDERRGALDVYAECLSTTVPYDGPIDLSSPMTWGRALERAVAETAAAGYGWELRMGGALLRSRKHPFIGATLDAEILPRGLGRWIIYEGKTTSYLRRRDWDEEAGVPPDRVLCQTQSQLLVTGAELCVVFCLIGGQKPCRIDVVPNAEFHALIVETSEEFMERIQKLDPPPPDWRSRQALQKLYPTETGEAIQLSREAMEWTVELRQLASKRLECERREEEIKNLVRATMGTASYGLLPEPTEDGKVLWKLLTESHEAHMVKGWTARVPRLVKTVPKGLTLRKTDPAALPEHTSIESLLERSSLGPDNLVRLKTGGRRRR